MKIRRLSIKNIASFETANIDFENGPLKDSPLFLICGNTGSGKTTILDAITLALYGKTPRYSASRRNMGSQIDGMAFNDARQLVRRGATAAGAVEEPIASAVVEIIGNDGKPYEARWSVNTVKRGGNKGRLKDAEWVWKDCSKGGIEYTREKEIEPVIKGAVGLGFEQFCRTTLLAQGQFTKFLLGDEDAKAEILEKLTNTEKFKKFGIAIGEKYDRLESAAKSIDEEIKRLAGLGQERQCVEAKIAELKGKLDESGKQIKSLESRRDWLVHAAELAQNEQHVRTDLAHAFANLKATEAETADKLQSAKKAVDDINAFLDANKPRAEMYAQSGAILTNLGYVRDARKEKGEVEANLAKLEKRLPALNEAKKEAAKALDKAIKALDRESEREDSEKQKLEAMNLKQLRKDKDAAIKRLGDIKALDIRIAGVDTLIKDKECHEKTLKKRKAELVEKLSALPRLKKAFEASVEKRDAAQADRDKVKNLIDDGIDKIVAELHIGDECPICKSRIEHLNTSEWFSGLMAEKNGAYAAADKVCKAAEREFNAAESAADSAKTKVSDAERQIADDKEAIKSAHDEIRKYAKWLGVTETKESVDAALRVCEKTIDDFDAKLENGEEQEKVINAISESIRKLNKAKDETKDALSDKETACLKCELSIREAKSGIKEKESRAEQSLADAAAKIVLSAWQDAWEADHISWEASFKEDADTYLERKASLPMAKSRLESLAKMAERIAECRKRVLNMVPELAADAAVGNADESSPVRTDTLLGQLELVGRQRRNQDSRKPQDLAEEDTIENLSGRCEEIKSENEHLRNELAESQQKIKADDECASNRATREKELEAVRAVRDEWKPIANLFGDQTGKKIQREIQSYVLMNVLHKANYYLKQLSDRYELSCEGLVLSVIDANEGYVTRPVNTLSGGEQFLVSLALALGLAGMNDSGLSVDMLLIDEGFGTLSGEYLNSAIEALERLNALTGSRKIGVISHVERLRERIRTHVEVVRNGHEPSTVRVISANGIAHAGRSAR